MDILIKGMKMPVDHGIFVVICPDGTIEQKVGNADNGYPIYNIVKDAKAVALPEHGRLGDLDLVEEWMRKKHKEHDCPFNIDAFLSALKKFPTIVEANYGTDN